MIRRTNVRITVIDLYKKKKVQKKSNTKPSGSQTFFIRPFLKINKEKLFRELINNEP